MDRHLFSQLVKIPYGSVVYDLGCGDGSSNKLLKKEYAYLGVDLKPKPANINHEHYKQGDFNFFLESAPKAKLILSEFSLQLQEDPKASVQLMRKSLEESGYLYLASFSDEQLNGFPEKFYLDLVKGMKLLYFKRYSMLDNPHEGEPEKHPHYIIELLAQKEKTG